MYASGKHAKRICDRCGWEYPYNELLREWTNLLVCRTCYDPKHEQLDLGKNRIYDPISLHEPRPDTDESTKIIVWQDATTGFGAYDLFNWQEYWVDADGTLHGWSE